MNTKCPSRESNIFVNVAFAYKTKPSQTVGLQRRVKIVHTVT
jgi:hypothetical protein